MTEAKNDAKEKRTTAAPDDDVSCADYSVHDVSASFYGGDNRQSGGEPLFAFMHPIADRNLCVGPLYIGDDGEYAGGMFTQVGDAVVRGEWVQARLKRPEVHKSVALAFRPGQGASRFAVLGSNDGSSFTELLRAEADVWPQWRLVLFPFFNQTQYQYYRLLLLQGQKGNGGHLCVHHIKWGA